MAGMTEELGLASAPCLRGAVGVTRGTAAARALKDCYGRHALGKQLGSERQDCGNRDGETNDLFDRHVLSADA
jgi:hypothetical protein